LPLKLQICLLVLLLVCGAGQVRATEAEDEPAQEPLDSGVEEQVRVEARRPEGRDTAAFATHLDGEEIARRGQNLSDLLRRVPGARVRDYGGFGGYATMSLRASSSDQVVVLVDGVPQNSALGGSVDLSSIPSTQLDRVTVYRGFAPASFGLGGIGGLVDVRTATADAGPRFRVDLLAGQLQTARASGAAWLATGVESRLRIGFEALRSEGDFFYLDTGATPFDPGDDVERERLNNDVEQQILMLQHVWPRLGGGALNLALRLQSRERGVPGVDSFPSTTARLDETSNHLTLTWTRGGEGTLRNLELLADGFGQEIEFRDLEGEIGLAAQDQTTRLSGGGIAAVLLPVVGRHGLTLRADLRHERADVTDRALEAQDRGGAARDLAALTFEDAIGLGRLTVAPSLRWEYRHDDFRAGETGTVPPPAPDVRESNWAGKVGLSWVLSPRSTLRGSVGRFFRSPTLLELFGDRGSVAGNPELRSESGTSAELGLARRGASDRFDWEWELVGFARRAEDLIRFLPASQGTAVARNVAGAEILGVEAAAGLRGPWGLSLDLSLTRQQATDTSGGFADGQPLPYQPEWLGYLGLSWLRRGWRVRWDVNYTGSNSTTAIDIPLARLPERWFHDLLIAYEWSHGLRLGLDVRNVFDRRMRDVARFPLPDRVVLLTLGWSSRAPS